MSSHMGVEPERQRTNQLSVKCPALALFFPLTPTVQVQQHVGLEQILGTRHLALRHTGAKRHPAGGVGRQWSLLKQWSSNGVSGLAIFYLLSSWDSRCVNLQDTICVCGLTIPSAWSASCPLWFRAHTPCTVPTGLCLCSRCWRTGSCGTGSPGRPSGPVYWTGSGGKGERNVKADISISCCDHIVW